MSRTEHTINTRYTADAEGLKAAKHDLRELSDAGKEVVASQKVMEQAARESGAAFDRLGKKAKRVQRAFEQVERELDDGAQSVGNYRRQVRSLDAALDTGLISQKRHAELLSVAHRRYKSNTTWLGRMTKQYKGYVAAIAASLALTVGAGIINSGDTQEQLLNQLEVALKSREAAETEFARLTEFAATTPVQLEEITDGFAKLSVRGLKPTIEELRTFGDIAGGSRKSLDQFVEALLDASIGEGERLKEFGIKMSKSGEEVTLAFGDMAITVAKDAEAIKNALLEIGEANFAGGLAKQAETLSGKWSTLKDAGNQLGAALFNSGIGSALKDIVDGATQAVNATTGLIAKLRELEAQAGTGIAFTPIGLIENALETYVEQADAEIAALVRDGAELRDVIHGTQAAIDSLDAGNMERELGRLRSQVTATERLIDALGQQASDARDFGDPEDYASARADQAEQSALLAEMRQRVAELEQALDGLGEKRRTDTGLTTEQTKALGDLRQGYLDEIAVLEQVKAAAIAGDRDLGSLRSQLQTLQGQQIRLDGGAARTELDQLRSKVLELNESIQKIEKIRLFEERSEDESEVLRRLIAAAEVPGTALEDLDRLETQLRTLQDLGIPLDTDGGAADRVRELSSQVANLTGRLGELKGELEQIETVDVVPQLGNNPKVDYTAGDISAETFKNGTENDLADQALEDAKATLKEMQTEVAASIRDGLISAFEQAAAAGKITFEGMFSGLRSQLPAIFERQALGDLVPTGDADIDAAATEAALDEAQATAAAVSSVLGVYYAIYSFVDSWVDEKNWEAANTGAVRLEQRLGELGEDLQRSGSAVSTALRRTGEAAAETIEDILFSFGGSLQQLGNAAVEFRINEGQYEVAVGEYVRQFGDASQQAFDYFIREALRFAEIDGAPDEIQRTLRNSDAESLAALERHLRLAEDIHRLPWDETERSIAGIDQRMRELFRFAEQQLLGAGSYQNIGAAAALDLLDLYNGITGRQADPLAAFENQSESFNRLRAELVAQAESEIRALFEELANLTGQGIEDFQGLLTPLFTGIFADSQSHQEREQAIIRLTGSMLNLAELSGNLTEQLQGRLAGLEAFLAALPPAIGPGDYTPPSGAGRQRRETREEFGDDLRRLRLIADGATEVTLALEDEAAAWEEQAERFRRAGVAQALLDEWLQLQQQLSDADFFGAITERGQALGLSDFQANLADLQAAQAREIEEAIARTATLEQLAEIEAIHRGELEALIELRERELQQYTDLANGISPWQRQLLDLEEYFEQARADELALIEAQQGLAGSSRELAAAMGQLDAAQAAAAESLYADLLRRLKEAGVEIPGFAETMLNLEFAMLKADLAAAAARDGFLEFLRAQNLTLEGLFADLDRAHQQALDGINNPQGFGGTGLGGDVSPRDDRIELETQRALDAVTSALLEIRGADPTKTDGERVADLEIRYRQALDAALSGDTEAAEEASRLALELRAALEGYEGTATGQYLALISRLDADLSGLERSLQNQLTDRQIQEEQLAVLVGIQRAIEEGNAQDDEPDPPTDPGLPGDGREPTNPGKPRPPKNPGDGDDPPTGPRRDIFTVGSRRPVGIDLPDFAIAPILPRAAAKPPAAEGGDVARLLGQVVDLLSQGNDDRKDGQAKQAKTSGAVAKALDQIGKPQQTPRAAANPFDAPPAGGRGDWPGGKRP